ncbi:hypothetical protein Vadar_006875 [Vaccinium darrowii]|uniref:Uncharacterized protein n=1 Tax=Vaccinium darrowii TaxID=229202 RepID=A0ACB7WYI5_9ERIC|nr:hypothetical protein Vadar_006875 [Vaccinium darrowii]
MLNTNLVTPLVKGLQPDLMATLQQPSQWIVGELVLKGAAYHQGQICAKGHAGPAVLDANAFLRAPLGITGHVLAMLP